MQCLNHIEATAEARCEGCQESFCHNCLVEINGRKYCASCKVMVAPKLPPIPNATRPCQEASQALTYAIVSLFCFGIILGPVALSKASKARKLIDSDPSLTGSGKTTAATTLAIIAIVFWLLWLMTRMRGV